MEAFWSKRHLFGTGWELKAGPKVNISGGFDLISSVHTISGLRVRGGPEVSSG